MSAMYAAWRDSARCAGTHVRRVRKETNEISDSYYVVFGGVYSARARGQTRPPALYFLQSVLKSMLGWIGRRLPGTWCQAGLRLSHMRLSRNTDARQRGRDKVNRIHKRIALIISTQKN